MFEIVEFIHKLMTDFLSCKYIDILYYSIAFFIKIKMRK
jgi:hypothetical protein